MIDPSGQMIEVRAQSAVRQQKKIVLIGECPSKTNDGGREGKQGPFDGPSGIRLAEMAGLTLQQFLDSFERHNLFHDHVPTNEWYANKPRLAAAELKKQLGASRVVVLLGRRADYAFTGLPQHCRSPVLRVVGRRGR